MRIVAGEFRGRPLRAPAGTDTRPTSDRVREALFSILGPLDDLEVLDLFAGSGALGFEALSRGALVATLVDNAPAAVEAMRLNLRRLPHAMAEIRASEALRFLERARARGRLYDLVFLDPPYRLAATLSPRLSDALPPVLAPAARVVTESDRRQPLELNLDLHDERRYGDTLIRIHRVPT